jgi:hypothetical protein
MQCPPDRPPGLGRRAPALALETPPAVAWRRPEEAHLLNLLD